MAMVLGIKSLMDDWIAGNKLKEFKKVCKRYKLKVREDVIFENVAKHNIPNDILFSKRLATTSGNAYPLNSKKDEQVYLFQRIKRFSKKECSVP